MRIHCTTTFLDGRDRFEAGDTRTVADDDAARFIAAGWATAEGAAASPAAPADPATLSIDNATHAQGANHG